jgi:hypothetical protein
MYHILSQLKNKWKKESLFGKISFIISIGCIVTVSTIMIKSQNYKRCNGVHICKAGLSRETTYTL